MRPPVTLDEGWAISAVTSGELEAGVLLARNGQVGARRLCRLVALGRGRGRWRWPWTGRWPAAMPISVRSTARRAGNDLRIAATALAHGLTLVTADEQQPRLPLVGSVHVG